ncbi:5-oxoprolinase subunit B family protein [Sporosarcina ureilytica]|uniref:Carboxyltransferase domain-containing protein n=1 Tax=Sporosarcina ureilytica TaxID=298596 RepID=A0A1D8JF95_9BACL|nr:carboxyltransferase domain-containing protein [Sporosarcina ureilytica]AOV07381.1 hypothetical protein BI350_07400 [Sporosarcina ureilytica]
MDYYLSPFGENGVVIELGNKIDEKTHRKVQEVCSMLDQNDEKWFIEHIPAYTNVTLFYDVFKVSRMNSERSPYQTVCKLIDNILKSNSPVNINKQKTIEIPICYGGEFGPDIEYVAQYNRLTIEEVIKIHSSGDYLVYFIGFAPGFPYIGVG